MRGLEVNILVVEAEIGERGNGFMSKAETLTDCTVNFAQAASIVPTQLWAIDAAGGSLKRAGTYQRLLNEPNCQFARVTAAPVVHSAHFEIAGGS